MPVEDDPAWPKYKKALDWVIRASDACDEVRSLPDDHEKKKAASAELKLALAALNAAAEEIN
jgi:hypothetical protein